MFKKIILSISFASIAFVTLAQVSGKQNYVNSRLPLRTNTYMELPLSAIKPQGWLKEMLIRQKNGAT